jgi:hypothetical protein
MHHTLFKTKTHRLLVESLPGQVDSQIWRGVAYENPFMWKNCTVWGINILYGVTIIEPAYFKRRIEMKKYNVPLAVVTLVLASLACQTITGGGDSGFNPTEVPPVDGGGIEAPTATPVTTDGGNITIGGDSEFPIPDDAINVINMGNDVVNFQTKLSLDEAMSFYRDEFGKLGYTERDLLTVTSGATFSMVFDGHESGKAIAVQGVDLGDGTINISISLQDV